MVREFTELQGVMGGIYAREEGLPETVWKAVYYHYLPVGVEADAPPSAGDLGSAVATWAAVSLADKLDTIVGLFAAGEKPTGSRDPYGLRRAAHGVVKILADLPAYGIDRAPAIGELVRKALSAFDGPDRAEIQSLRVAFWMDRLEHLLRQRGVSDDAIRAVLHRRHEDLSPLDVLRRGQAVDAVRARAEFVALARLFKRVNNIVDEGARDGAGMAGLGRERLHEPAETDLRVNLDQVAPQVTSLTRSGNYADALKAASALAPSVDRFFTEVLVMVDDQPLRQARLALLTELRDLVWAIADIPAVVPMS
jgi:glycyl-tRNA synthetase beta chain